MAARTANSHFPAPRPPAGFSHLPDSIQNRRTSAAEDGNQWWASASFFVLTRDSFFGTDFPKFDQALEDPDFRFRSNPAQHEWGQRRVKRGTISRSEVSK